MKWIALGLAVLAILTLGWLAAETRYGACVDASPRVYEIDERVRGGEPVQGSLGLSTQKVGAVGVLQGASSSVDASKCSRLPF